MGRRAADSVSEPPVDLGDVAVRLNLVDRRRRAPRLAEIDDEDHDARPEEQNGCDCDQPDTHVTRPFRDLLDPERSDEHHDASDDESDPADE